MSISKYYNLGKKILFPINRSITGNGVKKTLRIIKNEFPNLKIKKIPSGTNVFDWKVPPEWNISEAYVLDKFGEKIIDFKDNNLHIVGYSIPVNKFLTKKDLYKNLYFLKSQPNAIPYITSYYKKHWGFCISYYQKIKFDRIYKDSDKFKVVIKSNLNPNGNLHYGELIIKGHSKKEIFISTYICHPSMANNELSGPIVSMGLINYFQKMKKIDKTLRFIFIPETIGSIAYLSKNLKYLQENVIGGYNLSCIGDEREYSCMLSKNQDSPSDKAIIEAYKKLNIKYKVYPFLERGSDERQYNSPGIDLPISSIFRTKYGRYNENHTSLDNFNLVTLKGITGGFNVAKTAIRILLNKIIPKNKILCEPQMGKRGLYPMLSICIKGEISFHTNYQLVRKYMSFLQYSDGKNSLDEIAKKTLINKKLAQQIYRRLKNHLLID